MQSQTQFTEVQQNPNFPHLEENILQFWKNNHFEQLRRQKNKNLPSFVIYDGPPYVNKSPHFGHIAVSTIKDVVKRYHNQAGYNVITQIGWDSHGLPIQKQIDQQFKIQQKNHHQQFGIKKYNEQCKKTAQIYIQQWQIILNRIGRQQNYKNAYKSHSKTYMQSVWNIFKKIYQNGLISHELRMNPFSIGCQTALAQFQSRLDNKTVSSHLIFVGFSLKNDATTKFLIQESRPWMLIFNIGLFVNPKLTYCKIKNQQTKQIWIICQQRLQRLTKMTKQQYQIIQKIKGASLVGLDYQPLVQLNVDQDQNKMINYFKVFEAQFVNCEEGTGFYNCTPWFDQKSFEYLAQKKLVSDKILRKSVIDEEGLITECAKKYQKTSVLQVNKFFIEDLKAQTKLIFQQNNYVNEYFCIYSKKPIISKLCNSWYLKSTQIKKQIIQNSENINWISKDIQKERFKNWIQKNQDWCIARERYWGTPIPLWVSQDLEEIVCVGSIQQLENLTGEKLADLHIQNVDHLTIDSKKGKGKLRRVSEVLDCWFQASCMPYAFLHYPFSINEQKFNNSYPADIVIQGADQLICWFYTLNVISTALKRSPPFQNALAHGLFLQSDKKGIGFVKNNADPLECIQKYGADAIRLYLITSPLLQQANNLNFNHENLNSLVKQVFNPWHNAYKFLIQQILTFELIVDKTFIYNQTFEGLNFNLIDQWISSKLQMVLQQVKNYMKSFKIHEAIGQILIFLDSLCSWYLKMNKQVLQNSQFDQTDQLEASLNIFFDSFLKLNILMSPYAPFITETMHQNLKLSIRKDSQYFSQTIHLINFPEIELKIKNQQLVKDMNYIIQIIQNAKKMTANIEKEKQLKTLTIVGNSQQKIKSLQKYFLYIKKILNVAIINHQPQIKKYIIVQALPNLPVLGPKIKGKQQSRLILTEIKKALQIMTQDQIQQYKQKQLIKLGKWTFQKGDIRFIQKTYQDNLAKNQIFGGDSVKIVLTLKE